ncbi:MAG TPA: PTS glucitol/sorbitol transporter subunit IIA [Bacillus sp. (in: firmicutes)]|uniref:PTS glucitol/sorbitol transporter subunit IIA n=1 Tax=Bacillus litorisediminis TaxID=2922713 RepID=UPI001FAD7FBB|nr:PTS glucitol/sorbitol transporter subunit IIA [Bacillus litorisediminis]HWO78197.1 PTS glucitol/sorbitol transporter subunit IIA [Bacillus sp. (in: firmicutes)]
MTQSIVKEIGILVPSFQEDKIVILFGPNAPAELREISVIHEFNELGEEPLKVGRTLSFDNESYTITAVGSLANQNFKELGHISIYFQEPEGEVLPGAIFASPFRFPEIKEGTVISFK